MTYSRPDFSAIVREQDDDSSQIGIVAAVAIFVLALLIPLTTMEPATSTTMHHSNPVSRPVHRPNPIFWKPYRPYPKH